MNRKELEQEIIKIVAYQISYDVNEITTSENFINDLGFDSLDGVELIMGIEDKFDLSVEDEDFYRLTTVDLVADYVEKNDSNISIR
jgi:acyl carrier protein